MKFLIIAGLLFFSIIASAQKEKVTIYLQIVAYSQGGVELMPEEYAPRVLPNTELILVEYRGSDELPKKIKKVLSDDKGLVELELPEGKYGFVYNDQKLRTGVFLPEVHPYNIKVKPIDGFSTSMHWTIENNKPFEVEKGEETIVRLTYYNVTVCYMCP